MALPKIFHSMMLGAPFQKCMICECNLMEPGTQYMIEKAMKEPDVIFEMAICMPCGMKMNKQMSEESLEAIGNYFQSRVNMMQRMAETFNAKEFNLENWIGKCIMSGTPRAELPRYHIYAHCQDENLVLSLFPYIISDENLMEMNELLSKKSRGEMDDFADQFLGLPPELEELFKGRPVGAF